MHNAAAGYWSIATGSMAESNVLCAFDASFTAGLLEALTQVAVDEIPVLLVALPTRCPQPLHARQRPIPDAFGIALLLDAAKTPRPLWPRCKPRSGSSMSISISRIRRWRHCVCDFPAAALPLLSLLAQGQGGAAILEYLDVFRVKVQIEPCA